MVPGYFFVAEIPVIDYDRSGHHGDRYPDAWSVVARPGTPTV
jgi:hypothetical protein